MKGSIISATVLRASEGKVADGSSNGVVVDLLQGAEGSLHISCMLGKTAEDRAAMRDSLVPGTPVDVLVLGDWTIDGKPGFRVSQWGVVRKQRMDHAEKLMNDQVEFMGTISRAGKGFCIVALPDDLHAHLETDGVLGASEEERAARLSALSVGQPVRCKITAMRGPRVTVSEVA
jgi:ribosomal protein S1